jgi:hypothetical protein
MTVAGIFSDEFLDELRARTPIARLIGQTVKLARIGGQLKGCCPFHADKTPSFTVYPDNRFHCFGCGADGDAIDFVVQSQGIAFRPAVVQLAGEAGLPLPDHINGADEKSNGSHPGKAAAAEDWQPMVPPPTDAPAPSARDLRCDTLHTYRDAGGAVLFYIRRTEARPGSGKLFLPLTYGALNGRQGWHGKAPGIPRPLYGLDRLAARPDAPVLICEGEKAADAAQHHYPDQVCVTWAGGAKATETADWAPLIGRTTDLVIWADNDQPGRDAAVRIAKLIPGVRLVRVDDLADGFDAADLATDHPNPEAWLRERLPPPEPKLADVLSAAAWMDRAFPPTECLLGELLTTKSRVFMVGYTGLGKTMLGIAMAVGMATGTGFLHWRSSRPLRVLYLDGEMPGELLQDRIRDAVRRCGCDGPPATLFAYSADWSETLASRYPSLGLLAPLNTEPGQQFVYDLIAELGGVDVVFFDNVMSLVIGDQKDEIPWSETLPMVAKLTAKGIAQVWFDHTGHNSAQQYGSSTKAWRFDAVGIMTRLGEDQRAARETAFTLSFEPPGKARRRTPANWDHFAPHVIRLQDDQWTSETVTEAGPREVKIPPSRVVFYEALIAATVRDPFPTRDGTMPGSTTREAWEAACVHRGLIDAGGGAERRKSLRRAQTDLIAARWIAIEGNRVTDLKNPH